MMKEQRLYPRVCGGTVLFGSQLLPLQGLSPRVRGNQRHHIRAWTGQGSIPACAGEPWGSGLTGQAVGVYPRVCGGTPRMFSLFPP